MALYQYVKASPSKKSLERKAFFSLKTFFRLNRKHLILFSYSLMIIGISLLTYVVYPIISHEWQAFVRQRKSSLAKPIPETLLAKGGASQSPALSDKQVNSREVSGVVFGEQTDLTQIDSWFPAAPPQRLSPSKVSHYNLSIPRLGIINAVVTIGGEDLMGSLIHYAGTALPGEYGNGAIFGHSVLPQFFNPHDYRAIFSTIPALKPSDEILIDFDGIEFVYQVERYYEVSPEQVDVLQQYHNRACLKLITCVPPGLYLRRGIIEACLIQRD